MSQQTTVLLVLVLFAEFLSDTHWRGMGWPFMLMVLLCHSLLKSKTVLQYCRNTNWMTLSEFRCCALLNPWLLALSLNNRNAFTVSIMWISQPRPPAFELCIFLGMWHISLATFRLYEDPFVNYEVFHSHIICIHTTLLLILLLWNCTSAHAIISTQRSNFLRRSVLEL